MPPALLAELFVIAQLLTVSVPELVYWMAPPFCSEPRTALASVRPSSVTLAALMRNTRTPAPPLTVRFFAPGPRMVRFLVTDSCEARLMVPVTAKSMLSPLAASWIASRSVPAPLLPRLVTVSVLRTQRSSRGSRRGRKKRGRAPLPACLRPAKREANALQPRKAEMTTDASFLGITARRSTRSLTETGRALEGRSVSLPISQGVVRRSSYRLECARTERVIPRGNRVSPGQLARPSPDRRFGVILFYDR